MVAKPKLVMLSRSGFVVIEQELGHEKVVPVKKYGINTL
jgi:hypothetical protein